jgi:hypothetical protein
MGVPIFQHTSQFVPSYVHAVVNIMHISVVSKSPLPPDYKKQQETAMRMAKDHGRETYMQWSIFSMVNQATMEANGGIKNPKGKKFFDLAYMLLLKSVTNNPNRSPHPPYNVYPRLCANRYMHAKLCIPTIYP